jgi:hypothetical protein
MLESVFVSTIVTDPLEKWGEKRKEVRDDDV